MKFGVTVYCLPHTVYVSKERSKGKVIASAFISLWVALSEYFRYVSPHKKSKNGIKMNRLNYFLALLVFFTSSSLVAETPVTPTHGIATFGDLKYPETFTHFDYVNPNAPKGGMVKLGGFGGFDNFNPFIIMGNAATGAGLLFCNLLAASEDEPSSMYAYLAEKVELAPDKRSVTFTLNKNAKFSDGTPVTADDVIFSFNTLKEKGLPLFAQYYRNIKTVEKMNPLEVRFIFTTDKNRELPVILGQFPVFSKAYYEKHDFEKAEISPPVGCGPYKVKDFKAGELVTYERVPNWWGENLPSQKGQHNFDIRYVYYRDQSVLFEALKAGDYDFRLENIAINWVKGYNIPAVKTGKIILKEAPDKLPKGIQMFAFNTRKPLFQDRKVREALTKAFDFEWVNKELLFNLYTRSLSYFSNSPLASKGLPEGEELKILEPFRDQLPPELFRQEFRLPTADKSGNDRKALKEADALLKEAGWVVKNGKRVNAKTNEPFAFEFLLYDPTYERPALALQRNLIPLGIEMEVRTVTVSQYSEKLEEYDYDMIHVPIPETETPGNEQREFWLSRFANVKGGQNFAGVRNPVIDQLIDLVITSPDRQALTARVHALDRVLQWNYYGIPGWHSKISRVAYWNKFGMPEEKPKDGVGFNTWWLLDADTKRTTKR